MQMALRIIESSAARPALFDMAPRFVAAAMQLPGSCLAALDIPTAQLDRSACNELNFCQ
jgi:hypothetical protein